MRNFLKREIIHEAAFLVDRLSELEWSGTLDEVFNEFSGHVAPPLYRLKTLFEKLKAAEKRK